MIELAHLSDAERRAYVIADILDGRQPVELTLARIIRKPVPLDWGMQEKLYGLDREPR